MGSSWLIACGGTTYCTGLRIVLTLKCRGIRLQTFVGQEQALRLNELITTIYLEQWSQLAYASQCLSAENNNSGPIFATSDYAAWDVRLCRPCVVDILLDSIVALQPEVRP